jgi:hypothetical protein
MPAFRAKVSIITTVPQGVAEVPGLQHKGVAVSRSAWNIFLTAAPSRVGVGIIEGEQAIPDARFCPQGIDCFFGSRPPAAFSFRHLFLCREHGQLFAAANQPDSPCTARAVHGCHPPDTRVQLFK